MQGDQAGEKFTLSSAIGIALPGGRFKALIESGHRRRRSLGAIRPAKIIKRSLNSTCFRAKEQT